MPPPPDSTAPAAPKARLGIILLTLFISMVGIGIIIPILPLYAKEYGATEIEIGLLFAAYSACQFVFSPLIGRISDRIGRRPVLLISTAGTAIGFVLMGIAESLPLLFVARVIDGISGANIGTAQAYIADVTSRGERGRAMGLMGATLALGFIFGPALGGNLSHFSSSLPFFVVAAIAVLNFVLILAKLPESLPPEKRERDSGRKPLSEVFRHLDTPTYLRTTAANFLSVLSFTVMTTGWALFLLNRFGYDGRHSGNILTYIGIIGLLVQGGLVRRLLAQPGREAKVAVAGGLVMVLSLGLLPFTSGLAGLLLASTGLAIGNGLLSPTVSALASLSASPEWQGRALGVLQSAGSLGRTIGPIAAGWLLALDLDQGAARYAHTAMLVSAAISAVALAVLVTIRPRPAPEESAGGGTPPE